MTHILIKVFMFIMSLMISSITYAGFSEDKLSFWDTPKKGANVFNQTIDLNDIQAAKKYGIQFIRLAPDKFISAHRDFLIGDADNYDGLIKQDLEKLKQILNACYKEKIFVVITMLSLPGSRWKQNNQDQDDLRIWKEDKFRQQAARFWYDLALELKEHPAVVGYNILNEPHPERVFSSEAVSINTVRQPEVQSMLHDFYKLIIQNIRLNDKLTPIILDSSAYADSKTFEQFIAHDEKNILYSFHMYEPYAYTNHKIKKGQFQYPGNIMGIEWNKNELQKYMLAVTHFQKHYNIPSNRILVGEFGANRMSKGIDQYFKDLISIFTEEGWHFAFYAFREDTWDGMDYELGNKKLPWSYWQAVENGQRPILERKDSYPAFSIIKQALQKQHAF
jgi:endoglucanase